MSCTIKDIKFDCLRKMLLFVAGNAPNSVSAQANLRQVCEQRLKNGWELKIIDVLEDYGTALDHGILVTPALVILEPLPAVTVFGDLSDTDRLLKALRLI